MTTPSSFLTEEMIQKAIGQKSPPRSIDIEKGAIIKFAQAIEDDNPVYNDEQAARESARGEEGLAKAHEVERELRPALAVAERRLRECKGQLAEAVSRETDRLREKGAAEAGKALKNLLGN